MTRQAAKSRGEAQAAIDPRMSERGNLAAYGSCLAKARGERGELKHLSTPRKRKQT